MKPISAIFLFAALLMLIMVVPGLAQSVVFKTDVPASFCPDIEILKAKIAVLADNNRQLAMRARAMEDLAAGLQAKAEKSRAARVVKVKRHKRRHRR